jgi:hypothetical protein
LIQASQISKHLASPCSTAGIYAPLLFRVQIQEVADIVEEATKIAAFDKKLPYLR